MSKTIEVGCRVLLLPGPRAGANVFAGQERVVESRSNVFVGHWLVSPTTIDPYNGDRINWHTCRLLRLDDPSLTFESETERELCHEL